MDRGEQSTAGRSQATSQAEAIVSPCSKVERKTVAVRRVTWQEWMRAVGFTPASRRHLRICRGEVCESHRDVSLPKYGSVRSRPDFTEWAEERWKVDSEFRSGDVNSGYMTCVNVMSEIG